MSKLAEGLAGLHVQRRNPKTINSSE